MECYWPDAALLKEVAYLGKCMLDMSIRQPHLLNEIQRPDVLLPLAAQLLQDPGTEEGSHLLLVFLH